MSDADLRRLIVDALSYASAEAERDDARLAAYLDGASDIPIGDMQFDSLAAMEFCISIELNTGVSVSPDELHAIPTLAGLERRIRHAL